MRKIYAILSVALLAFAPARLFNNTVQSLPFTQNWTTTTLITANDDWSGVAGIEGYLGQNLTAATGIDPQTVLGVSAVALDLDVIANQLNPNTNTSGGVAEFEITDPVIALQGSGTADAPYIVMYVNTTSLQNITVAYNLRDIDGSADNAIQAVALQYRVGNTGNFANVPAGFVADATQGPSLSGLVTAVSAVLPAACNNAPEVQVRVITTNAAGNDEWVGIDDINITGSPLSGNSTSSDIIANGSFSAPSNINYANYQATDITDVNSLEVAQFTIRDGGAAADGDAVGTILTNFVMSLSNPANVRRVALYDGTTELAEVSGSATVSFSGLTLTAPDDGSKTFSVRVTYNASVTDNQQYQFAITSATADGAGSGFSAANAGGATSSTAGDDNRIEVTADRLAFVQNTTSPTGVSVAMTPAPTVSANDVNANRDLDFTAFIDITSTGTLLGTPVSTQAVAGLSTFSGAIIHTVAGTGLQLTAASTGLTSATSNLFNIQVASSATDYFRSAVVTGNWNDVGSWESSPDNSTWNPSTLVPDANANIITILNGHDITVAIAAGGDQIVVEAGGTLTLNANFTLADGADPVDMTVNGTLVNTSGTHSYNGAISFNAGSVYRYNRNGSSAIPTATWDATSTLEITGVTNSPPTGLGQSFGNLTWNCPSQSQNIGLGSPAGFTIAGNLTVTSTGGVSNRAFRFTAGTNYTLTVGGSLIMNGGHLGLTSAAGTMELTVNGNVTLSNSSELYLSQAGSALGTLNIGGDLSINNATLTETGSANGIVIFNKNGTQSFSASSATISNIVNYTITNTSTLLVNSGFPVNTGATLTVDGTLIAAATVTNNGTTNINNIFQINEGGWGTGTGFVYDPAATLVFNNTSNYDVNDDAYWPAASGPTNVTVQNTGGITMNVARTVSGLFQTAAGVLNGNNLTLNGTAQINANGYFTNAPIYGSSSLLKYNTGGPYNRGDEWNATGVGTIGTTNGYPNDVQVSNNTTINLPNGSGVDRACARDLIIDNGSALYADFGGGSVKLFVGRNFDMSGNVSLGSAIGGDMYVKGNFTHNAGTFNPNGRAVFFDGPSGDQTITGVTTFDYLEVNKAAGNVVLANSISCNQGLTLASGKIVLGANDLSLLNNFPSALSASSSSSYVVTNGAGAFRRAIGTAFIGQNYHFQVGTLSNLQTAVITFSTLGTDNSLAARFITGPAGNAGLPLTEGGDNLVRVANDGYWEVNMASPTTNVYTGAFIAKAFTDITDYTKLHLVKRTDAFSNWQLNGIHIATSGSNVLANLQRSGMAGFSQFAVGGESNISLPVSLLSFSGYKDGSRNQLSWTTASELNNRGFEVQRSTDGVNYTAIGFVSSLATGGNSNDQLSYRFTDNTPGGVKQYYRLRQEDIDGRSKLSTIVLINGARPTVIALRSIFPNPVSATASMIVDAPSAVKLTVLVTDMAGRNMVQQIVNVSEGSNTVSLNIASLQSGTYLLRVMSEEGEVVTGKLVKQ